LELGVVEADGDRDEFPVGDAYQAEDESHAVPEECAELFGVFFFERYRLPGRTSAQDKAGEFRGSIAQRLILLSTLRSESRVSPRKTRSLPTVGPALPDGIGYPQGSSKRFHIGMILIFRASWPNVWNPFGHEQIATGRKHVELSFTR
jgi:hypothetical protein